MSKKFTVTKDESGETEVIVVPADNDNEAIDQLRNEFIRRGYPNWKGAPDEDVWSIVVEAETVKE